MKPILKVISTFIAAGTLVLAGTAAANATETAPVTQDSPAVFTPIQEHQDWYKAGGTLADPFPQTTAAITCGGIVQHDDYTITSQEMLDHYKALITGGVLPSSAQDQEFSPHNYSVVLLPECAVTVPQVQDYLPKSVCLTDGDSKDARVAGFVLDNTGSNRPVDYTINGTVYTVSAGEARHVDGLPVSDKGTTFKITAGDRSWTFDAPANTDCTTPPVVQPKEVTPTLTVTPYCYGDTQYNRVALGDEDGFTWDTDGWLGGTDYIATASEGYKIVGPLGDYGRINEEGQAVFHVSHMTASTDCAPTTPPVVTPPVVTPPTPPFPAPLPPVVNPVKGGVPIIKTAVHDTPVTTVAAPSSKLAYTGSQDAAPWIGFGGLALLLGLGLVIGSRTLARRN